MIPTGMGTIVIGTNDLDIRSTALPKRLSVFVITATANNMKITSMRKNK
jgi:hypothetical protein